MIFLFDKEWDNIEGAGSYYKDLPDWDAAEKFADENNMILVGEFTQWIDELTGETVMLH